MSPAPIDCPLGSEQRGGMLVPEEVSQRIFEAIERGDPAPPWPQHTVTFDVPPGTVCLIVNGVEMELPGKPEPEPEPVTLREVLIFDLVEQLERQVQLLREENERLKRERDALIKSAKDWRTE